MRRTLVGKIKQAARRLGLGVYRLGQEWQLVEPAQLDRFLRHFEVDCVFDIGANEGQYATGLREIGYTGLILSFEPHPEMAELLRGAAATDPKWEVFEVALDSQVQSLKFNIMASSQFSSLREPDHSAFTLLRDQNTVIRTVSLTTETLANAYPRLAIKYGFSRPFLKMDTQGSDLEVAKGAGPALSNFVGLQSELALTKLYQAAPGFAQSLDYYQAQGFKLSSLVPNNASHFPDLLEIDCIMYNPAFQAA